MVLFRTHTMLLQTYVMFLQTHAMLLLTHAMFLQKHILSSLHMLLIQIFQHNAILLFQTPYSAFLNTCNVSSNAHHAENTLKVFLNTCYIPSSAHNASSNTCDASLNICDACSNTSNAFSNTCDASSNTHVDFQLHALFLQIFKHNVMLFLNTAWYFFKHNIIMLLRPLVMFLQLYRMLPHKEDMQDTSLNNYRTPSSTCSVPSNSLILL